MVDCPTCGGGRDSLDFLFSMRYALADAIAQAQWAYAYPYSPEEEREEIKRAREQLAFYDEAIHRRLAAIKSQTPRPHLWQRDAAP